MVMCHTLTVLEASSNMVTVLFPHMACTVTALHHQLVSKEDLKLAPILDPQNTTSH